MKAVVIHLKLKWFVVFLFLIYISIVFYTNFGSDKTSFMLERHIGSTYEGVSHNIIPFTTIGMYLFNFHSYNLDTWFYNTFGNILLFIPMGILFPVLFPKRTRLFSTIVVTMLFSFTIETMQYVTQLGVFDVDDIILNTIGGFLGFMILVLFKKGKRLFH